jgi:hypothetical protein
MRRQSHNCETPFGLVYKGRPIATVERSKSQWQASQTFNTLEVIHFWHRLPSEFGLCDPKQDLLYMTAWMLSSYEIKAVENFEQENYLKNQKLEIVNMKYF